MSALRFFFLFSGKRPASDWSPENFGDASFKHFKRKQNIENEDWAVKSTIWITKLTKERTTRSGPVRKTFWKWSFFPRYGLGYTHRIQLKDAIKRKNRLYLPKLRFQLQWWDILLGGRNKLHNHNLSSSFVPREYRVKVEI